MSPLLGSYMVRHSIREMWPQFQSQTTHFISKSSTLVPSGGAHYGEGSSWVETVSPLQEQFQPPRLRGIDQKSLLLGMILALPTGNYYKQETSFFK